MSELLDRLREEFRDPEFRHIYAAESLNTYIATQIKVLREQREWTQAELAEHSGMKQSRISALEDVNYSSWSLSTLKRLAQAFDLRLSVSFSSFGSLLPEIEFFGRRALERPSFERDPVFTHAQVGRDNTYRINAVWRLAEPGFTPRGAPCGSESTQRHKREVAAGRSHRVWDFGDDSTGKLVHIDKAAHLRKGA